MRNVSHPDAIQQTQSIRRRRVKVVCVSDEGN
jgi:hypothetical protein